MALIINQNTLTDVTVDTIEKDNEQFIVIRQDGANIFLEKSKADLLMIAVNNSK
jgi:hypothetical protein